MRAAKVGLGLLLGCGTEPAPAREPAPSPAAVSPPSTAAPSSAAAAPSSAVPPLPLAPLPGEDHLTDLRQLTFGGENAEAYLSHDETRLVFQSKREDMQCDQIFTMNVDGSDVRRISNGQGRTTCAYFLPGDERILYASTHGAAPDCLAPPDRSRGYVWKLYPEFDLYTAARDGSEVRPLAPAAGYDAEATVSPRGDRIVFTSMRDGDPEIYSMGIDGSDVQRLTRTPGYDGGAFFSPDGSQIVYRANHPEGDEERAKYEEILADGLVRPTRLELFVMAADGSKARPITSNGKANFAPFFHPDGRRIIFASNVHDPAGRDFDLYLVGVDGGEPEQVTHDPSFDGFPMFWRDGRKLVFASNRHHREPGETNIFVAGWRD